MTEKEHGLTPVFFLPAMGHRQAAGLVLAGFDSQCNLVTLGPTVPGPPPASRRGCWGKPPGP